MLIKTEKGRLELRPGHRSLGQRERALLLVADGQQSESQLAGLFSGDGRRLLEQLLEQGYLERRTTARSREAGRHTSPTLPVVSPLKPETTAHPPPVASPTPTAAPAPHGDTFSGARSVASARMFLFDLSERMFAPRDRDLALRYREALREARDPQAMLVVSRLMMADVQVLAGAERAQSIQERLQKLLPAELLEPAA